MPGPKAPIASAKWSMSSKTRRNPAGFLLISGAPASFQGDLARAFADSLKGAVRVRWYPEMYHEILHDPQRDEPYGDIIGFLAGKL